jgi:hypothetical protein
MPEAGAFEDVISAWSQETKRRWETNKFFKLWQAEDRRARPASGFSGTGLADLSTDSRTALSPRLPSPCVNTRPIDWRVG